MEAHILTMAILLGSTIGDNLHHSTLQAPGSGPDPVSPYYSEYPDYGYSSSGPGLAQQLDRQGLEAVLGAPVVITAFAAALFGGLLSPLISSGLSRMAEFEIEWPEVKQKVETGTKKKTKTSKNRTKLVSKARELVSNVSWLEALETLNSFVGTSRYKRSAGTFDKFLSSAADTLKDWAEQDKVEESSDENMKQL